jgi:hypothetical protein
MRMPIRFAAVLALALGSAGATPEKVLPQTAFKVVKAEFGMIGPGGFQPANKVPFKEGQSFGWVIQLDTKKDRIKWREELKLPAAPQSWQTDEKSTHTISADRRTSILEREARLEDGLIYNFWQISPGDPKGRYTMRVMIEGMLVGNFDFDVE